MKTRQELHDILKNVCKNVYFRSPSKNMKYPCIKYDYSGSRVYHADNNKYLKWKMYSLIIIDENPDSEIPEKIEEILIHIRFDRQYQAEGLNHFVYTLYF